MALLPLFGHLPLRARLTAAARDGRLPASLLFQGPRGVGKQRFALWLGQYLLCEQAMPSGASEPCGRCVHCRYAERGQHPDLHWFFPRPRLKDGDASPDEIRADLAEVITERMAAGGIWGRSSGMDGIMRASVHALLERASLRPALSSRMVFVVGDAERMVPQSANPEAANAFLKLLEEPPAGATLILTSSEPGALLPTIRSRVVTVRVPPLPHRDVQAFLAHPAVASRLGQLSQEEALRRSRGAPGSLFSNDDQTSAFTIARELLDAALAPPTPQGRAVRVKATARLGVSSARGAFTEMLDALTELLHARAQQLVRQGLDIDARRTAAAVPFVESAKGRAQGNVSPQLLGHALVDALHDALVHGVRRTLFT